MDDIRLDGKTVIVTGASAGIGFETAKDMARRGATVILACRNKERGQAALEKIKEETGSDSLSLKLLDLSLMASVREFASDIVTSETPVNILINNAGIAGPKEKRMTSEGLEECFATNHFGPFLLTNLLLDRLKQCAPSRVVTVSSLMHRFGRIEFDNLNSERAYSPSRIYSDTKLASLLFTRELSRRCEGTGVSVFSVHPGVVHTEIFRNHTPFVRRAYDFFGKIIMKTPAQGAQTTIYCAVTPGIERHSGCYFADSALKTEKAKGRDEEAAKRLWEESERITGLV